jgi:hypothetical protein
LFASCKIYLGPMLPPGERILQLIQPDKHKSAI